MEFDVDIDTTHACDTQQQVERFVALFEGDVGAALRAVNEGTVRPLCAMVKDPVGGRSY